MWVVYPICHFLLSLEPGCRSPNVATYHGNDHHGAPTSAHIHPTFLQECMGYHAPLVDHLCEKLKPTLLTLQLTGAPPPASQHLAATREEEGTKTVLDHRIVVHDQNNLSEYLDRFLDSDRLAQGDDKQ